MHAADAQLIALHMVAMVRRTLGTPRARLRGLLGCPSRRERGVVSLGPEGLEEVAGEQGNRTLLSQVAQRHSGFEGRVRGNALCRIYMPDKHLQNLSADALLRVTQRVPRAQDERNHCHHTVNQSSRDARWRDPPPVRLSTADFGESPGSGASRTDVSPNLVPVQVRDFSSSLAGGYFGSPHSTHAAQ